MDNQGFLSVNLGMNVGNSSVSTSGPFIQQLPGIQQIFTQNIQAKPITPQNVLQGNLIPVSTQQTGNQTLFAQSLVRPQTGSQSVFGHQQLLTQQTGLQQVLGPRSLYAANYQVVPRNYAVFNQNMPGAGLTVQLSPQQLGANIGTLSQADQQQLVQPAALDPNLSLQTPGQQHLAFQNSNGQLTLQSPSQQLTLQSPNQIALQSPTQQITVQNQNQFALQNQNLGQLAPQMISHGQNNNVIVQSQGQGMIIQGDNILPQGHGQNLFVQGQGLGPNFSQQVNQGQLFGPLQNLASNMLPNQIQGIYTQTPVLATQGPVNANAGILSPNLVTQVVKTDNNGNQLRMRAEHEQKRPKTVNQQSRDIMTLNQQMQILAQIAAQGQLNVQTSQPSHLLTNITSQSQGVVNAVNQNQYLSNLTNHQNSSLPSFGHFLLHHQQQQNLPHPFLQNTGFNPIGLQQTAFPGMIGGQQNINGNVISAPNFQNSAIGQTPGLELVNNNNTVSNNHNTNLNVDLTNWNLSPVLNPGVNVVQGRPGNTVIDSRNAETGQSQTGIVPVNLASPLNVSAGTSVSKISEALSTVNTPTSSTTCAVSKLPITFVTYGLSTVSTSKISTHTSLATSDKPEVFRDKLSPSVLALASSVKQEKLSKKEVHVHVSGNEGDKPSHTIVVPYGWVRALEGDSIVYYSPTCTRLTTIQHIKQYLATEGTCKCGLECPVLVEKVFNFNPSVISLKWSPADFGARTFEEKCHHRQKNFAMAMMQINHPLTLASHLESSIVTNSIMMSPRMSSTLQEKVKKDQKKRKKSVTHTGESLDSHIVSQLIKQKDLSNLNTVPLTTTLSQQSVSGNVSIHPKETDVLKRTNTGCESIKQDKLVTEKINPGCDTFQHLESNSCDKRSEIRQAGVSLSSVVKGNGEPVSKELTGSNDRLTVPISSGSVSDNLELVMKMKERIETSAHCDTDTDSKKTETKEESIPTVDQKLKPSPLISENSISGNTTTITTSVVTSSVQQLQQPLAVQTSGRQNSTTAPKPSTCVSNAMISPTAKSPIKEKGTKQLSLPSPNKSGRCSSRSSSSSCISAEMISCTHSPEKATSSSDKEIMSVNEYNLYNSLGQVITNLGFDGSNIPPVFDPNFTCNSALLNKLPMLRGASTFPHLGIKDTSMASSPAIEKQPTTLYPPSVIANLHKLASPPNQQVFPLTQVGQRLPEPSHNRMSKYIHGEVCVASQKVSDVSPSKGQILPEKDSQVKSCAEVGSTTDNLKEVDIQAEKMKHKALNSAYERDNVKVTELFESDSPPPNVDVSQLKDRGHGVIPKQKIASFLENPAEFLKQQTVIVNNSISSTSSSPKPDGNEKYLKPITISKELETGDIPTVAERSESASSDRLDLPKEQIGLNDENISGANVTKKNSEQFGGQPDSVSNNSNDSVITEIFSTNTPASSKGNESVEASYGQSEVQKPVASAPPTPTTIVHYTPVSLSCHQISVNKAKLHSNFGNENTEKSVKQRALHPLENVLSDQAISHAFQQMFPQIMQEALLENLGLLNSSFQEISNSSAVPSTKTSTVTGLPKMSESQANSRQQQPGRPSLTQRISTSMSFVSPGSSQVQPPNFPIHHILGNQIRSGGDFPASTLLSAAARAQLFQQNNPLHLIMTQQAGGQIVNPFIPSVGNIAPTSVLPETAQNLTRTPIQVPLQSAGNFQALPVSICENLNTRNNSVSTNQSSDTNEKARLKSGSAKISELLSRVDSEKLKHKLTQVPSSSSDLPPGLDMALLLHHLHQQQQQQLQLHNNISLQQNPTSGIQSISVSTVTSLVTNENNIPINQSQQASSNLLNLPANMGTNLTDGLQGAMSISGLNGNDMNGNPTMLPHMLQMYSALGLQQGQDILNNNPQSNTNSGTLPQLPDNPVLFGHLNFPGVQSLPVGNADVRQLSNPVPGTATSLGHMTSGSLISPQNQHVSFCPTYSQQDPVHMNPNLIMHLVNPVNGDQVFLNMQGLGNRQVDQRNVGLVPSNELRTSQVSVPGVQTQQVGNQISMINGNKSNLQQVRLTDNEMDIQNISQNPQAVHTTNKTNSLPDNTNCNNVHMPSNSVLPVNLINVQQSFSGSNNLTAMQLQTLQLQQQLLQQIQQVQGMQNLINQYNLQGIVNSSSATGDKNSKSPSSAASQLLDANGIQNSVQTNTGNVASVSNVPDVSKQSVINSALTKAGLMTVTPVQVNTQQSSNSGSSTVTNNAGDNETSRDSVGIRKANHVIAAAADTTDDSPAARKVDIGTETEAFDDEEDDDGDAYQSDASSDTQEMGSSTTSDIRKIPETTSSPAKASNSSGATLNVSTCLAIATQKGQVDSKMAGLKSSIRVTDTPVENTKRSSGDLKLKISRKHLLGNTVSSIVSRTKKHKITEEYEDKPKVKFEKKELRSSTVAATKASSSLASSSSETLSGESSKKLCNADPKERKENRNEEIIAESGLKNAEQGTVGEVLATKEARKLDFVKSRTCIETPECDSSVNTSELNETENIVSENVKDKKQSELTNKIAAALSNQRGRWQLSTLKVSSVACSSTVDDDKNSEQKTEAHCSNYDLEMKGVKRPRDDPELEDTASSEEEGIEENESSVPTHPRSFNTGDLVWGQIRGFPSWPGKLVDNNTGKLAQKPEDGKLFVRWFGDHTITQVEPQKLKTLSEGLEAHHRARKKHRRGRKMNSNLEQAIHQAMAELDKQAAQNLDSEKPESDKVHKPVKRKPRK